MRKSAVRKLDVGAPAGRAKAAPAPKAATAPAERLPLVLDLDGALIASDVLVECLLAFIKHSPLESWRLVVWLLQGRAVLKARLAERVAIAVELLPESPALVAYAQAAHRAGRDVYLATGADRRIAEAVSRRYPFIKDVLASGGRVNLKGRRKAEALAARFPDGFAYAGDSRADAAVWRSAKAGVFAGTAPGIGRMAARLTHIEGDAARPGAGLSTWRRALRLQQWAKNALVFAPMILAGKSGDPAAWIAGLGAFVAMGAVASATYLVNDLTDIEDDRRHPAKRLRPLASGELPLKAAILAAPLLLAAGFALAALVAGLAGVLALAGYTAGTLAYSLRLKRVPILDVLVLAGLFTGRLLFGAAAAQAPATPWLLVLCMFAFASLALSKRAAEIARCAAAGTDMPVGRGYRLADAPFVSGLGAATAVASVLVLVLYLVNDAMPVGLYARPSMLWGAPVALSLWFGRIWLLCGRGELHEDPVAFAVRDRVSLALGAATLASVALARMPL